MSDSLSKHEIEDVLTSIRRLVSQEVARSKADRLLLTPALRVVSEHTGSDGEERDAEAPRMDDPPADPQGAYSPTPAPTASEHISAEGGETAGETLREPVSGSEPAHQPGGTEDAMTAAGPDPSPVKGPATGKDDEFVIDENTLRDLVAQLLREELRGAMGERLTRSIRKLVRAEVARALSEREFL